METTTLEIHTAGDELLSTAAALAEAAEEPGASQRFPAALALIEQALRAVSGGVGAVAHEAVADAESSMRLTREQQARLETTMHALAQDIGLTARSCARAREIVGPLLADAGDSRP